MWLTEGHRLLPALAMKHGYATIDEYKAGVQRKFSLLETGVIHRPSTRLLLINVSLAFSVSLVEGRGKMMGLG